VKRGESAVPVDDDVVVYDSTLILRYPVADIATFVLARAALALGAPAPAEHVALHGWLERVLARPAVRRELDESNRYLARALAART
jgi:glutathione S-transferase